MALIVGSSSARVSSASRRLRSACDRAFTGGLSSRRTAIELGWDEEGLIWSGGPLAIGDEYACSNGSSCRRVVARAVDPDRGARQDREQPSIGAAMSWTNKADRELRARAERVIPGGMYGHESAA